MNHPHNPNQRAHNPNTMVEYRVQLLHNAVHRVFQTVGSSLEPIIVHEVPAQEVALQPSQPTTELEQDARQQLAAFYENAKTDQPTAEVSGEEVNLQELFMQSNPVVKPSTINTVKEDYDLAS